jgi:hypothetical protein
VWGVWNALAPGDHEDCFGYYQGLQRPACQVVTVSEYATTSVTGVSLEF